MKDLLRELQEKRGDKAVHKAAVRRITTVFKKLNDLGSYFSMSKNSGLKDLGNKAFADADKWGKIADDLELNLELNSGE